MPVIPGTISYVDAVIKYLNPAKSPYYLVVAATTVGLCIATDSQPNLSSGSYRAILVPSVLVLFFSVAIALKDHAEIPPDEQNQQLKTIRSLAVSSAIVCMIDAGLCFRAASWRFQLLYWSSGAQIGVFVIYILSQLHCHPPRHSSNLIQIGLVTVTLLIGFSICLCFSRPDSSGVDLLSWSNLPAAFLYLHWLACMVFWAVYLSRNIKINVEG